MAATATRRKHESKVTGQELEQDIAMKWIAGLAPSQLDAIDDADDYLTELGVIDKEGSRTGASTGGWAAGATATPASAA